MAEALRREPIDAMVEPVVGGLYVSGSVAPPEEPQEAVELPPLLEHTIVEPPPVFRPPDGIWAPWAVRLRRFARAAMWAFPVGMGLLALTGVWGWPTPTSEGEQSPGTWLVCTLFALVLALVGVIALAALLSLTPGGGWALSAVVLVLPGTVLLAAMLGVVGVARPVASRLGQSGRVEPRLFDGAVTRWLGVGGFVLLAAGWLCLAIAVLAAGVLNRIDGWLLAGAVGVATIAAYAHLQFLIVIATMLALAASLGLAFTASRLNPDGVPPPD
jgi:hypothetical protein